MRKSQISNRPGNVVASEAKMPIVPPAALRSAKDFMPESDPLYVREQEFKGRMDQRLEDLNLPKRKSREERVASRENAARTDEIMARKAQYDDRGGRRRRDYQGRRAEYGTEAERFVVREDEPDLLEEHAGYYEEQALQEPTQEEIVNEQASQVQQVLESQEKNAPRGTSEPASPVSNSRGAQLEARVETGGEYSSVDSAYQGGTPAFPNSVAKNPRAAVPSGGRRR